MATKAGIWIDQRQAVVVLITDEGSETKKVVSDIARTDRPRVSSKSKKRYSPADFVAEDSLERKLDSQLKAYFDEVIACVGGAEAVMILGPGEAKGEFLKRLKHKKFRGSIAELETSDQLTDRQIVAKVRRHFATTAANRSVTPKKSAKAAPRSRKK